MAVTSGSFDTTHRVSGSYNTYATFSWWVSGSGSNYTDVSWELTGKTAGPNQYIHVYSASVTVNGTSYSSWSGNMYNGTVMLSNTTRIHHTGEFTFSASAGIAQYSSNSWYDGSGSWTLPARGTTPTELDVTINSVQDTGATMRVTLGSYGTPSSEANRYIEAAIMGQSTYGGKYRYGTSKASTTAVITVNNNSATNSSNPLTIVPNTQYWYGAYATNTVMSTSTVKGTFITLPAYISDVTVNDTGGGNVTVSVVHASEGTATTAYTEYSYNQTDWTTVQDTFSLEVLSATTIYVRRRNSTGTTPVRTVSIVPATTVKLYGSVNNQAKEIRKLYGSVNGKAVIIRKLYGSVNGRSKLIYVHSTRPGESRDNPIVINSSNATFSKKKHITANVTESTATDISSWYLSPAPVFFHVSIPAEYNPMGVGLNITITIGGEQKINALSTELGSDQRELLLQWDGSSSLTVL